MKKIGIITWHYYNNYGSVLQAYALQSAIEELGYNVKIINYRNLKFGKINFIKETIKLCLDHISDAVGMHIKFPFDFFRRKYLRQTKLCQDEAKLTSLIKDFDAVVCGSDQIWASSVYNPVYMLNFVSEKVPKFSYAASIGLDYIDQNIVDQYRNLLKRFNRISVREETGMELLKQQCGIPSTVVLDPTLLITSDKWREVTDVQIKETSPYIFCYFLNKNHQYKDKIIEFAQIKRCKLIGVSDNERDKEWMELRNNIGPSEWLNLISHSEFVFTDSYHATIFSLLFHKKFITFERFKSNDKFCQNSRIYQLDKYFDIGKYILSIDNFDPEVFIEEYDYLSFEHILKSLRDDSMLFLKTSLKGE